METDRNGATAVPGVYVVGRLARPGRSQAIISAGDGAAAAIDILSKEKGRGVRRLGLAARGQVVIKRAALALLFVAGCDDEGEGGDDGAMPSTGAAETGSEEPCRECEGAPECHSLFIGGHCWCEYGHEWEDPTADDDFTCVPIAARMGDCNEEFNVLVDGQCYCEGGYNWCNDADASDLTCCEDPTQAEPEEE